MGTDNGKVDTKPSLPLKSQGQLVSACMLQQSMFTFAGVGIGLAFGLQRRNLRPFVISVTLGTIADATYAYMFSCRGIIDDFNKARESEK